MLFITKHFSQFISIKSVYHHTQESNYQLHNNEDQCVIPNNQKLKL
uniref:Uncharacterized protein n=1 Tax=Arundo donax TaxID=35708 RepID=A0A0A9EMP9_ARUDO